jgi:hypothetical protein
MSNPHLPAEILDHIVDHLHDTKHALRNCCLVSKSWIPRTRVHLFANVNLLTTKRLRSWKEMFLDPSTSPAYYAKTLSVNSSEVVTVTDTGVGWIAGFSHVMHLEVGSSVYPAFFVPFHGFSPVMKSLRVAISSLFSPHIFNLILSFPLLEDLAVTIHHKAMPDDDDGSDRVPPSSTPMFTGSLELRLWGGMKPITHWLLSLPGGIHFRKLIWAWYHKKELSLMMALAERCSHTLESLDVTYGRSKLIRLLRPGKLTQNCF